MSLNLRGRQGRFLAFVTAELSRRRMGLSGQDPSLVLDRVNPNPSRMSHFSGNYQRPGHPQKRPKYYGWPPSAPPSRNLPGCRRLHRPRPWLVRNRGPTAAQEPRALP